MREPKNQERRRCGITGASPNPIKGERPCTGNHTDPARNCKPVLARLSSRGNKRVGWTPVLLGAKICP